MAITPEEIKYSSTTKIAGAAEDHAADVVLGGDGKGRLAVDSERLSSSVSGVITVGTTAIEAKVGASALGGRRLLVVVPTNGKIFYGSSSGVTVANGLPLFNNQTLSTALEQVWLIAESNTQVRVLEAAS